MEKRKGFPTLLELQKWAVLKALSDINLHGEPTNPIIAEGLKLYQALKEQTGRDSLIQDSLLKVQEDLFNACGPWKGEVIDAYSARDRDKDTPPSKPSPRRIA